MSHTYQNQLEDIISNLYHTWNREYPIPQLHPEGKEWRCTKPPRPFHDDEMSEEQKLNIKKNWYQLHEYLHRDNTWFKKYCDENGETCYDTFLNHPIAYFSLEFGLVDWLQIYSGGLGVLAGDFLKESSDMGVPMVAIGLFYHHGYFQQSFDDSGYQQEQYPLQLPEEFPFELVKDKHGHTVQVSVEILDHDVWLRAWEVKIGNTKLYLLDSNFERNHDPVDRMITSHLYGGDNDTRLRQEITLGIGGPRLLHALEIEPSLFHMNEGHSGFLVLEVARKYVEEKGLSFEEAISLVDEHLVFTNHTLKTAGNDTFNFEEIESFFTTYLDNLHTDLNSVYALGEDRLYAQGHFSMTLLGLRNAKFSNAVSLLHGKAAEKLWPDYPLVPITNGVHMPTWVSKDIHELFDDHLGEDWHEPATELDINLVDKIPDKDLWHAHQTRKTILINSLSQAMQIELDPDALTIAWARRFAAYKRPDLILTDLDRLAEIVNKTDRKVQIIFTGKAHPRDTVGKGLLQKMYQQFNRPEFAGKLILVPEYNWLLAHYLVSGVDIWLNTPRRFEEASGTSGMKAAANGVLQFTTLDGWTDEVYWEEQKIGWVIDEKNPARSLYDRLANEILPLYYDKDHTGYGEEWVARMKRSIKTVLYHYSTTRMMKEYIEKLYLPLIKESGLFN